MRTAFDVGLARAVCCRPPSSVLDVVVAYLKLAYTSRVADEVVAAYLAGDPLRPFCGLANSQRA